MYFDEVIVLVCRFMTAVFFRQPVKGFTFASTNDPTIDPDKEPPSFDYLDKPCVVCIRQ